MERIRAANGELVSAAAPRTEFRRAFGDCTEAMLEANAAGRIHPDQEDRLRRYQRMSAGVVTFLIGVPVLCDVGITAGALAAWPPHHAPVLKVGGLVLAGLAAIGIPWWRAVRHDRRVVTVRGAFALWGGSTSPELPPVIMVGGRQLNWNPPLDRCWAGLPVTVHVVQGSRTGDPLYLSGDLDVDRLPQIAAD